MKKTALLLSLSTVLLGGTRGDASLAGGRTLSIGVVTQAIDSPFYGVAMRGIEEELAAAGYSPLFVSGHWNAREEAERWGWSGATEQLRGYYQRLLAKPDLQLVA